MINLRAISWPVSVEVEKIIFTSGLFVFKEATNRRGGGDLADGNRMNPDPRPVFQISQYFRLPSAQLLDQAFAIFTGKYYFQQKIGQNNNRGRK